MDVSTRTRTRIGVVALIVLLVAVGARLAVPSDAPERPGDNVALISLSGQIVDTAPVFSTGQSITPRMVRDRLEQAAMDPQIGAVILRVNSPGGGPAASQEILDIIADHPDPVVVSMGDQAASGGYYIALGADRIVAQASTLTGSIGVIFPVLDPSEFLDDLGIELDAITSGEHKEMFLPGKLNEERREILQRQSDMVYQEFVDAVVDGRDLPEEEVLELATGETFTGRQALDAGLVDEVGGRQVALDAAAELGDLERPQVVEMRPGLLEQLSGPASQAIEAFGKRDPARQLEALQDALVAPPEIRTERENPAP